MCLEIPKEGSVLGGETSSFEPLWSWVVRKKARVVRKKLGRSG